jgi:hypothetical protein
MDTKATATTTEPPADPARVQFELDMQNAARHSSRFGSARSDAHIAAIVTFLSTTAQPQNVNLFSMNLAQSKRQLHAIATKLKAVAKGRIRKETETELHVAILAEADGKQSERVGLVKLCCLAATASVVRDWSADGAEMDIALVL